MREPEAQTFWLDIGDPSIHNQRRNAELIGLAFQTTRE